MILRREKGSPLTADELDNNFKELQEQIQSILQKTSEKPAIPEGVASVEREGDDLVFKSTYGRVLGHVTLPILSINPRGEWSEKNYYAKNDWVIFQGKTYACLRSHVSSSFIKEEGDSWRVIVDLSEKGPQKKEETKG